MRGRRPKPSRIKALTGNPGKRPLNEPGQRRVGHLLRRLWILDGSSGADPEIRDDGEIANGLPDTIPLPGNRKQAGRADDTRCIRVRFYACKPQPDICTAARPTSTSRFDS
jgi:hypothetical protein